MRFCALVARLKAGFLASVVVEEWTLWVVVFGLARATSKHENNENAGCGETNDWPWKVFEVAAAACDFEVEVLVGPAE